MLLQTDVVKETFRAVDEVRSECRSLRADVDRMMLALAKNLPEQENRDELFTMTVHDDNDEFLQFCGKLESSGLRKLMVSTDCAVYLQKCLPVFLFCIRACSSYWFLFCVF